MRLDEAYSRLGLNHPDERSTRRGGVGDRGTIRRAGTTTHMLIELCLDLEASWAKHRRALPFVLVTRSNRSHEREKLKTISSGLGVSSSLLDKVTFVCAELGASTDRLRGMHLYSWGIFCDFGVVESHRACDPNLWPLDRVRKFCFDEETSSWSAHDRDGCRLASVTTQGRSELLASATCPIEVVRPGEPPVSQPPWVPPGIPLNWRGYLSL